jgi:hypothetical protein
MIYTSNGFPSTGRLKHVCRVIRSFLRREGWAVGMRTCKGGPSEHGAYGGRTVVYCSVGRQRCQLLREIKHEETVSILSGGPSAEEVFRIPYTCNVRRYRTLYLMYHLLPPEAGHPPTPPCMSFMPKHSHEIKCHTDNGTVICGLVALGLLT